MTSKQLEKRESIVHEIVSTEKNYVAKLGLVINYFLKPLTENADSVTPFISRANLRAIFSELIVIHGLNSVLLTALEKAVDNASPISSARIGGVFVKIGSFLRWYHSYVSNYDLAFQTLKKLKTKTAAFRNFVSTTESKPELGFTDLESLLIQPIQRIPQYNLLLADLAKVTTVAHPDFSDTTAALALLNQIGSYINEKKREAENIVQVIEIGKTLVGFPNLAVPYRRFVRKASVFCLPDGSPSMSVTLYAFNDVLLLTQESTPGHYNVLQYAYWDRVSLLSQSDASSSTGSVVLPDTPLGFSLRLKELIFSLVANSPDEKREWVALVKEHIESMKRKATEKEVALALKRKLQSLHNHTSSGSVQIRALGVLAKGIMHEESSDQHSAPVLSPRLHGHAAGISALAQVSHPSVSSLNSGILSASSNAIKARAQEAKAKSKKTRESIEAEVKTILLKEGVTDGSIDEFLSSHRVEATYIAPISLSTKVHPAGVSALLAISHVAFFIFLKSKLLHSGFLYDIKEIASKDHPDFSIRMNDGMNHDCKSQYCDDIIYQLRRTYLLTYFGIPDHFAWQINTDEWRQPAIVFDETNNIQLGNFVRTYRAACAYLDIPLREDFIWDIMHNPSNAIPRSEEDPYSWAELNLSHLEELTNNDMKTLMMALRFNPFFTSLVIRDVILSRDAFSAISDMLKYNHALKRIVLVNNGLGKEHISMLNDAFNTSPSCSNRKFEVLEIRENSIESVLFLSKYLDLSRKSLALNKIDLSNTNLGSKAVTSLLANMRKSTHIYHTLTTLKLAGCKIDSEGSAAAAVFLATPCAIRELDVSNTGIRLVQVLEAMTRGCIYLASLNISQNKWDKKLEPLLVKFLTGTDSLRELRLSATGISAESLSHLIESVSTNVYVTKLALFADENSFGALGGSLIAKSLKGMSGIVELSLADNDFGDEGLGSLFQTFASGTGGLDRLVLDANFRLKTSKGRSTMMKNLIKMACSKNCKLTHLSIAGAPAPVSTYLYRLAGSGTSRTSSTQLRTDLIPFLDSLPRVRVAELNISGHRVGPRGILALGRALQESTHVKKLWWDENGTTNDTFASIVHAIQANTTLISFPAPFIDLSSILAQGDPVVSFALLSRVEALAAHIARNNTNLRLKQVSSEQRKKERAALLGGQGAQTERGSEPALRALNSGISRRRMNDKVPRSAASTKKEKEIKDSLKESGSKESKDSSNSSSSAKAPNSAKIKQLPTGSAASSPGRVGTRAPKSARGAMETAPASKSTGSKVGKSRGASTSSAQSGGGSEASSPQAASSLREPLDSISATEPIFTPTSAPSSGKLRHLRQPSNTDLEPDRLISRELSNNSVNKISPSTAAVIAGVSPRPMAHSSPNMMETSSDLDTELTTTIDDGPAGVSEDLPTLTEDALSNKGEDEDTTLDEDESLEEVLELDDYNEDDDEEYAAGRRSESEMDDEESVDQDDDDEDDDDDDAPLKRSHYHNDDDDDQDNPVRSPRSPHHIPEGDEEDVEDLIKAAKSTVVIKYRPTLHPTDSFKELKSAALELPTDLNLSDSDSDQPEDVQFVDEDEEESMERSPRSGSHLSLDEIQQAVALEYGAEENSDEGSPRASEPDDDDGIDRSAFDHPPTIPFSTRTLLSPRNHTAPSLQTESPSPRLVLTTDSSPSPRASIGSRPSSPVLGSPTFKPDSAPSTPRKSESPSPPVDSVSRFASVLSVGQFEHAPILPSLTLSPRGPAESIPAPTQLSPRVIKEESPRKPVPESPDQASRRRHISAASVGEFEPTPSMPEDKPQPAASSSATDPPTPQSLPSPSAPKAADRKSVV